MFLKSDFLNICLGPVAKIMTFSGNNACHGGDMVVNSPFCDAALT